MNPNEELIRASVHDAVIRAVTEISADAKGLLEDALARETNETAKSMLSSMVENLTSKYPKLKTVVDYQNGNPLYISFFMRTLNFLPGDAVSLFLGAVKIPFEVYMLGGMLGTFPGVILATIFGANIKNPGSPAFWLSAVLLVMISVFSILIHRHISRKKK